ncbi:type II toxin-antitoxin system HicA family toxin [Thermodesulfobium fumaratoxidans]
MSFWSRGKRGVVSFKRGELRVTVPIHSKELKKGTLSSIIKQSGLRIE